MRIVVTGGTGLLGRALTEASVGAGDDVTVLTRTAQPGAGGVAYVQWDPSAEPGGWVDVLDGADAVVNLAGASIAKGRWTSRRKVVLWDSRIKATRALTAAMAQVRRPPPRVVSASAVGYYGSRGDETLTEESGPGQDFLARLCVAWEKAAQAMATDTVTVACVRSGLVLSSNGGALPRMARPFAVGLGGPVGDGSQWVSWIHIADWVAVVRRLITEGGAGPFNLTAPEPVVNADFAQALGRALHRPSRIPTPAFALRLALGEMADGLLLASQRVLPAHALASGYSFRHRTVGGALRDLYGRHDEAAAPEGTP